MNTVDIKVSARIPEDYIDDIKVRLNIYMRLSKLRKIEDLQKLSLEIEDRFGIIPEELEKLFLVNKIKILCHKYKHIVSIKGDENKIIIRFDESILGIKTFLEKEISQDIEIKTKTMIFSSKNPDEILEEIIILINKLINLEKEISEKFDQAISLIN